MVGVWRPEEVRPALENFPYKLELFEEKSWDKSWNDVWEIKKFRYRGKADGRGFNVARHSVSYILREPLKTS